MYQNNLLELHRVANKVPEIVIIEPLDSLEACYVIQALHQWKIVILKLSNLEFNQAQRVVDFLSGGIYAINGQAQLIGKQTIMFTPNCIQVITTQSGVVTV